MVKGSKIVDLDEYRMLKALDDELEEFPFDDDFLEDEEDELDSENWNLFEDLTELRKRVDYYQELHEKGEISEKDYYFSKVNLGMLYKQNGPYQRALEQFEAVYELDSSDLFACRHEIMALYILTSQYDKALAFFKKQSDAEHDILLEIPLLVGAILDGHDEIAHYLIADVKDFAIFCQSPELLMDDIISVGAAGIHRPDSLEAVYVGLYRILPLLMTAGNYVQAYLNDYFSEHKAGQAEVESLAFLSEYQIEILLAHDIYDLQDFQVWTETEILALPQFGKVTLEKLKEAGVIFSH
ncbi:tetratricopeptide repeat protein [Streptococcus lutetiensis]|uniref:tetratricopeptide repeat protein n=1 Tax=Streptococcus lutetiensis TaxID=150055 RepID=UPI001965E7A0|nr:hypothetical protein [Streptococcus lutetiensis]